MKHLGTISEDELERVKCATKLFHIPENDGYGVTLTVVNGKRAWVIISSEIDVMIIGDRADFTDTYVLPIRLINDADIQAHLGHKTVELTIHGDTARFTGEQGFSEMKVLYQVEQFSEFNLTDATTAQILGYHLGFLINLGTSLPTGINEQDIFNRVPSLSRLKFCKDSLEIMSEFKEVNAPASHTNIRAEVTGRTGEVAVSRTALRSITHLIEQDDMGLIKLSCDTKNGENVIFDGDDWKIIIRQQATGAGLYFNRIIQLLEKDNFEYQIGDDGRICANIDDHSVEMQMLDGRLPIIRCTIELVSGLEKTWALLREIDQQNEGRVCTKFFMRGDAVIACVDLVCSQSLNIGAELNALIEDSIMLDTCLSALGAHKSQLELFA